MSMAVMRSRSSGMRNGSCATGGGGQRRGRGRGCGGMTCSSEVKRRIMWMVSLASCRLLVTTRSFSSSVVLRCCCSPCSGEGVRVGGDGGVRVCVSEQVRARVAHGRRH